MMRSASGPAPAEAGSRRRRSVLRYCLTVAAVLAAAGFFALGCWQWQRLYWKLDLIARVDQRVHAAPGAAPGPQRWAAVTAASDEYRHVALRGRWLDGAAMRVQAVTARGSGYWLLVPLCLENGTTVLVNRGFLPGGYNDGRSVAPAGQGGACAAVQGRAVQNVTGLLRLSEPGGGFLRRNDPQAGRWYSRDVAALGRALGLEQLAPYFIDADADPAAAPGAPVGGLTVISFKNDHLVYALTWFALSAMVVAALLWVRRQDRRRAALARRRA